MKSINRLLSFITVTILFFVLNGCTSIQPLNTSIVEQLESSPGSFSHDHYAKTLKMFVTDKGLVHYRQLIESRSSLDTYYWQIANFSPDSHPELFPGRDDKLAYWINAYNATVIRGVMEYYPIKGVEDIEEPGLLFFFPARSGFFLFQRFNYGGAETSLYYLENNVIRDRFKEPRIHFALNCASRSCPQLPNRPFLPSILNDQLDYETVKFINDKNQVRYDQKENTLFLSSIFKWFKSDFTEWLKEKGFENPSLVDYILLFLNEDDAKKVRESEKKPSIEFLPYDWGLNDAAP